MHYRVLKDHVFTGQRGEAVPKKAGELVDILMRRDETALLRAGVIGDSEYSARGGGSRLSRPAAPFERVTRIGIFLHTSPYYSGGRIHLYQYALSLAQLGAEVYLITDGVPRWMRDYPKCVRVKIVHLDKQPIPMDLDLIVTDSKGDLGKRAVSWRKKHAKMAPLVCFNFETPNWVEKFCPDYARQLQSNREVFKTATYLIANSGESARYLREWVEKPTQIGVLPPVVNTYALAEARRLGPMQHPRPYAVWSARGPAYKGGDVAMEAVLALKQPFDLVMFGQPRGHHGGNAQHAFIKEAAESDVKKFRWMLGATLVLAPSLFEGYGMVPAEALCCDVLPVVYDLPVLRQEYEGCGLEYVKWGDRRAYKRRVTELVNGSKRKPNVKAACVRFGLDTMKARIETLRFHEVAKQRVSVQLLAYWGFLSEALESVYSYADEIIVAFGPTTRARKLDDGSLERLRAFPDPEGKILLRVQEQWQDKRTMRNWCLSKMSGNYHILLDGDEVWVGLDKWLKADIAFGCPRWLNFWHDARHWVHDASQSVSRRWGVPIDERGSVCPHYRCSFLRRSYYFRSHPMLADMNNDQMHIVDAGAARRVPSAMIYHFGHMLPREVMAAKHQFYIDRDGNDSGRRQRRTAWHEWRGELGDQGDGLISAVTWPLPEIVQRAATSVRAMRVAVGA